MKSLPFPIHLFFLFGILSQSLAADGESLAEDSVEHFKSEAFTIDDRFDEDSRSEYRISGEVKWDLLELTLPAKSSFAVVKTLDPTFQAQVELWPGKVAEGKQSVSQLQFQFSNGWSLIASFFRVREKGKLYRLATLTELSQEGATSAEPVVTELRRTAPFVVTGDVEHWTVDYSNGVMKLFCNGKHLFTTYSGAFTSWLQAVGVAQPAEQVVLSRFQLQARTIGYSPDQRELYTQISELRQRADAAQLKGELNRALELDEQVIPLSIRCHGEHHYSHGLFHQTVAQRLQYLDRHEEATKEYATSHAKFVEALGESHPESLLAELYLAEQLATEKKIHEAAVKMRTVVLKYISLVGIDSTKSQAMLSRLTAVQSSDAYLDLVAGEYASAVEKYQEVNDIFERIQKPDYTDVFQAKQSLVWAQRVNNSTGSERKKYAEYIQLQNEFMGANLRAKVKDFRGKRARMLELTREIHGDVHHRTAEVLLFLNVSYFDEGRIDTAFSLLNEGLEILRKLGGESDPFYAQGLGMLGAQLSMVERYDEATKVLEDACNLFKKQGRDREIEYGNAKLELGRHLIRIQNYGEAGRNLHEAFQLFRSLGQSAHPSALKACERLADLWRVKGNLKEAESYLDYQRQIVLANYGPESEYYIDILMSEARHLYMRHKWDDALNKYLEAGKLVEKTFGKSSGAYEGVISGIIEVNLQRGDAPGVLKFFEERLDFEIEQREILFNIYSEQEQIARSVQDLNSLDALLLLALEGNIATDRAYDYALAYKGAVTARQRSLRIAKNNPALRSQYQELAKVEEQLSSLEAIGPAAKTPSEVQALLSNRSKLQKALERANREYMIAAKRSNTSDIQQVIPEGTVLIDYFEYLRPAGFLDRLLSRPAPLGLVAFIVTGRGDVHLVDLGTVDPVVAKWGAWVEAMQAEPYYELKSEDLTLAELTDRNGGELRKLIWDPLVKHLEGATTIVISPSTHLAACPFAALPAEDGESFLIEHYAFASLATPRLLPELLSPRETVSEASLLLIGGVDFDSPAGRAIVQNSKGLQTPSMVFFSELPNTELEVGPIRVAFTERFGDLGLHELRSLQATESKVREEIHRARYVHFDTHGFCLRQSELDWLRERAAGAELGDPPVGDTASPLRSGIALAGGNQGLLADASTAEDGILWSNELSELDLHRADLVTLSACQTAIGDLVPGEGILGAQRAMYLAGARSSLAALWAVSDHSTSQLMSKFYSQYWTAETSKAEALQQAMIFMLRHYEGYQVDQPAGTTKQRTPPALWAAFMLHGDWR